MRTLSPLFDDDVTEAFSYEASVAARNAAGGTSPESVRVQIAEARRRLG
jgi:argininosuccinate lyase